MAAPILDMSKFTFDGDVIRAVSEMVFDETLRNSDINAYHTIYPNIVTKKELGFIGSGGLVGVKNQGCNPTAQPWKINTRKATFDPKAWEVLIHECWTDLQDTAVVYSLRTGVDIPDFQDTDYMNVLLEVLGNSMREFWWRLYWFSDTAAANVTPAEEEGSPGVITDGVDVKFFNILDGFWKQITQQLTANTKQRVTITENTGASYEAQQVTPANAKNYFQQLYYKAPLILRQQRDGFILTTQSLYDAYMMSFQDTCCLESARVALLNGMEAISISGVPIIPIPEWDTIIQKYEDTGKKWNNPNRAIYTTKAVLAAGIDNANAFDNFSVWYDRDTRLVKIEGMGQSDAVLANPDMLQVAI